jgi:hypothetical protein
VSPTYVFRDSAETMRLVEEASALRRPVYVHIRRDDLDLTLRRAAPPTTATAG